MTLRKVATKAAVIMTDGENTMTDGVYTAYGHLSEGRLGAADSWGAVSSLNARFTSVCKSMNAAGIDVYTVAFRKPGTTIETLLRSCASKAEFYFLAGDGSKLKQAFKDIGMSLSNLRLSK